MDLLLKYIELIFKRKSILFIVIIFSVITSLILNQFLMPKIYEIKMSFLVLQKDLTSYDFTSIPPNVPRNYYISNADFFSKVVDKIQLPEFGMKFVKKNIESSEFKNFIIKKNKIINLKAIQYSFDEVSNTMNLSISSSNNTMLSSLNKTLPKNISDYLNTIKNRNLDILLMKVNSYLNKEKNNILIYKSKLNNLTLKDNAVISSSRQAECFDITYDYNLATKTFEAYKTLQKLIYITKDTSVIENVLNPSTPEKIYPNISRSVTIAILLGLVLGVGLILFKDGKKL